MTINEIPVTGRKFRRLVDEAANKWERISFWHKASDCEFDDGMNAQAKLGAIKGFATSIKDTTEKGYLADAKDVKDITENIYHEIEKNKIYHGISNEYEGDGNFYRTFIVKIPEEENFVFSLLNDFQIAVRFDKHPPFLLSSNNTPLYLKVNGSSKYPIYHDGKRLSMDDSIFYTKHEYNFRFDCLNKVWTLLDNFDSINFKSIDGFYADAYASKTNIHLDLKGTNRTSYLLQLIGCSSTSSSYGADDRFGVYLISTRDYSSSSSHGYKYKMQKLFGEGEGRWSFQTEADSDDVEIKIEKGSYVYGAIWKLEWRNS